MLSTGIPSTVGPPGTVITIAEPITSDAVMMPMVARSMRSVELLAEIVEPLQVEVDPGLAAPRLAQQPREVARNAAEHVDELVERAAPAPRDLVRLVALAQHAPQHRREVVDDVEVRVVLAPQAFHRDQRLEHQRQIGRQHDRVLADDRGETGAGARRCGCP